MRSKEENLRPASKTLDQAVKPTPPPDLWEKMDAVIRKDQEDLPHSNGITVSEFARRYGIEYTAARHKVERLVKEGKLKVGFSNRRDRIVKVYEPA